MSKPTELKEELNHIVNEHYQTPEIISFNSFPMTVTRAGTLMVHRVHYTINRRNCWGSVQSSSPMDVKRLIWAHEQDELVSDPRFGGDHHTAEVAKAMKLTSLSAEAIATAELVPGCKAAFEAWLHLSKNSAWLRAFSASAVLERANNNRIVKGGGSAVRDYQRYTPEVRQLIGNVAGHDVHNVADEDHSDMMEVVLDRYALSDEARRQALAGARESLCFDRAYRGALATYLKQIGE